MLQISAVWLVKRVAFVLVVPAWLAGCATSSFKPLPQTDDDFHKTPEALRAEFGGVTETPSAASGTQAPAYGELPQRWGAPSQSAPDRLTTNSFSAGLSLVMLGAIGPTGFGAFGAMLPWLMPRDDYVRRFEKGDYAINVYTSRLMGEDVVPDWEWTYHDAGGDRDVFADLRAPGRLRLRSRLDGIYGKDWANWATNSHDPQPAGGLGAAFVLSTYVVPAIGINLGLGYRQVWLSKDANNHRSSIVEFPLELALSRDVGARWTVGGGLIKHLSPKRVDAATWLGTASLDAPIGVMVTADYRLRPRTSVGVRLEHVTYTSAGAPDLDGDSAAVTLSQWF